MSFVFREFLSHLVQHSQSVNSLIETFLSGCATHDSSSKVVGLALVDFKFLTVIRHYFTPRSLCIWYWKRRKYDKLFHSSLAPNLLWLSLQGPSNKTFAKGLQIVNHFPSRYYMQYNRYNIFHEMVGLLYASADSTFSVTNSKHSKSMREATTKKKE